MPEGLGVVSGVTQSRIRVRFGDSASLLYRGSLYMIHAVRSFFNFWRRTENPRVGGSIPSLATESKPRKQKQLSARVTLVPLPVRNSGVVANGVTLARLRGTVEVKPAYERVTPRLLFSVWSWVA